MATFGIFSTQTGHILRTVTVPDANADVDEQLQEGEIAAAIPLDDGDPRRWLLVGGELTEAEPAPDPAEQWMEVKQSLQETISAGYPSSRGPVDMRPGARQAMLSAIALGQGIDLILLDNRIEPLTAAQLVTLFTDATAWEQAQVMAAQALRPE